MMVGKPTTYWAYLKDPQSSITSFDVLTCRGKLFRDVYQKFGIGVWPYKPVRSVKIQYKTYAVPVSGYISPYWGYSAGGYTGFTRYYDLSWTAAWAGSLDGYVIPVDEEHIPIPTSAKQWLSSRLEDRLPSLRPDIDLFVFLIELADFKDLLKGAIHVFRDTIGSNETILQILKRYGDDFLTGLKQVASLDGVDIAKLAAKELSEHHLMWAFAIRPFIDEVTKIWDALFEWRSRIEKIKAGLGKIHDLHTSITYDVDVPDVIVPCYLTGTDPSGQWDSPLQYGKCEHRLGATVKYRYVMPAPVLQALDDISLYLTSSGLNPNLDSLWELVPFSFVLDWVFNTDRLLQKHGGILSRDPNDVQVEIVDFVVSLKEETVSELVPGPNAHPAVADVARYDYQKRNLFARWTGEEAFDCLSWWFTPPSFMQVLLGASLVGANQ